MQKRETGHTWEIEFQPLGILLSRRNKGSIGGVDFSISRVFGEDFSSGMIDNVLQRLLESVWILGVNFGSSKPGQTISRFFLVFEKDLINNFAEFSKHHGWGF